jgi:hypothetical protein
LQPRPARGIKTDDTVAGWGSYEFGPVIPPSGTYSQVSAGSNRTCTLTTDGTVVCWGDPDFLNFGQATPPAGEFSQVSAGYRHSCGMQTNGTVAC